MKRIRFGAALLGVLLVVSLLAARWMDDCHSPVAEDLSRAAEAAMAEDWETAQTLSRRAAGSWERHRKLTAVFADHGPMEDIDSLFAQLKIFAEAQETVHFAATCAQLSRQVDAMGEAHGLMWWNIL